jgi:ATP-binding cassette subfamily B protein
MNYHQEEEIVLGKAYDSRLMRRLIRYLAPYKLYVAVSIILLLFISVLQLAGPYLTKIAIDRYIATQDISGLSRIALIFLAILVVAFFLRYLQIYIMQFVGQRVMFDMRMELFSHLQEMSLSFFDKNPVGRLITRLTNDVEVLNEMLTSGIIAIFGDIFSLIGIVIVMLWLDFKLALVSFVVLPLLIYATVLFRQKARESYRAIRTRIARINAFLQESIVGMPIIQIFNREKKNLGKFEGLNHRYLEACLRSVFYHAAFHPSVEIIGSLAVALIIWYGGGQILKGALTFGALVAFIQYVNRFYHPIRDLSEKYNIMQSAMASSERIFKLLDTPVEIKDPELPLPIEGIRGEIEFKNVWFAYNGRDYVLRDISFRVRAGEKVAIVGATGGGKTSIISLLARFYDPQKGKILIDEIDIRNFRQKELRRYLGIVQQDVFLFSGTIENNIKLGENKINFQQVKESASYVNADKFIKKLPHGYQEDVRERGSLLSVGQKQLLAFARALAFDPRILVLDEATSSVDTETEMLIQDASAKLLQHRTSIVIAHRLSTIKDVDRIIVIHKGRVKEVGTHQELLQKKGIYYRLYQLQYQAEKEKTFA